MSRSPGLTLSAASENGILPFDEPVRFSLFLTSVTQPVLDFNQKHEIAEAHRPQWRGILTWLALICPGLASIVVLTLVEVPVAVAAVLVLVVAFQMHTSLIAFHEAAHNNLCPLRPLNDAIGTVIGSLGFMSLTLYRASHRTHHKHLGTERDEELWPFVLTGSPRWVRRLTALVELNLGLIYTPLLFLRSFLRRGSTISEPNLRRRIRLELALVVVLWTAILTTTAMLEAWMLLLTAYLIPAAIAGNVQSWRKYAEHMGMLGSTALGCTRSIPATGTLGRILTLSLLNEPYHAVHHRYARIPYPDLPRFESLLTPDTSAEPMPYESHAAALLDMVRGLGDPRIGAQWLQAKGDRDVPAAALRRGETSGAMP